MRMDDWFIECMKQETIPDIITKKYLNQLGEKLLQAKIRHVTNFNNGKTTYEQWTIPKRLKHHEIHTILTQLFTFKNIRINNHGNVYLTGVKIEGSSDIWNDINTENLEYTANKEFINDIMTTISPTITKTDINEVWCMMESLADTYEIPTPNRHIIQHDNDNHVSEFWANFSKEYTWDKIHLDVLYVIYSSWFSKHELTGRTFEMPIFRKQILHAIQHDAWTLEGRYLLLNLSTLK